MSRGGRRIGTAALVLCLPATLLTARPAAAAASPAAVLQAAARNTMNAPGFTVLNHEQIRRMGLTIKVATQFAYQAPDRVAGGAVGQRLPIIEIGTTKYTPRTTKCPGGATALWYWKVTVGAHSGGAALATGYLQTLLTARNVRRHGNAFTSVSTGPAPASQRQAFGKGPVVTTVTAVLRDGYVEAASTRLSSSIAVLTNSNEFSAIGSSPPVAEPPASLAFTSDNPFVAPKPPLAAICPAA